MNCRRPNCATVQIAPPPVISKTYGRRAGKKYICFSNVVRRVRLFHIGAVVGRVQNEWWVGGWVVTELKLTYNGVFAKKKNARGISVECIQLSITLVPSIFDVK